MIHEALDQLLDGTDLIGVAAYTEQAESAPSDRTKATLASRRREQHLLGRRASSKALTTLLGRHIQLASEGNDDGLPAWPAGACGSITHAGNVAIAVAGRAESVGSVGVDLEFIRPGRCRIIAHVATSRERAHVPRHVPPDAAATAYFSIREAIYKCLYPITREPLSWLSFEVATEWDQGSFATSVLSKSGTEHHLVGRFAIVGPAVLSLCRTT